MSDLSFSEQERLRQLELELEQATGASGELSSSQGRNAIRAWAETWGRPLLTVLAILGCILLVGLIFRVFGTVLKWTVVAGLGYLLYVWVVAPRLGLSTGARPKADDRDLDRF
ncbi:hypothetical protein ACVW0Q_000274 [Thermostichus sp. MS-CIW-21]|jgi:hypothetical protein|uniref:hypothetical protein n=1 Tax=unclassified Synechococcus TaxID=2626047 RepID=UPI0000694054|nr:MULTISPECIES: hypothetical protein [unclassified Synechococcus]ABC98661.1 conserved domain protein [Synechococcus sp. JA-3-3Ab]PIK91221.1 hypothetical protein SYN65AY6LI_02490 [Synechococcus sp. 65AY6Li]